jgi:hypothetical protein
MLERGIDRALVIDDGYDSLPTALDLVADMEAWANFVADMGVDHEVIEAAFPGYHDIDTNELVHNDNFVRALWGMQGQLTGSSWEDLFGRYRRDLESDRGFLGRLEEALGVLNIRVIPMGRDSPLEDPGAPLVFVDLFLGGAQDEAAIEYSVRRVGEILAGRPDNPPLVVLMSRSDRLDLNKDEFRRETQLLGAMFRVSGKQALLRDGALSRLLSRMVQHQPDGRKVAAFLHAWDRGLDQAKKRFLDDIRRLDLSDYAQIRDLLLDFEGQPLGSYLLDVFDRVLQHEIEADDATIAAAIEVNDVDLRAYIAPHIAGTPDLQELVYRSIYQHPRRLAVPATVAGVPVGFGDILAASADIDTPDDLSGRMVLVVITPACDLGRSNCKQVLLVGGKLKALTPGEWTYSASQARTPIIIFSGARRYWIAWDLKDLRTWTPDELVRELHPVGPWRPYIRMREGVALELQQQVLADLGRVGQLANMPATFPVRVELLKVEADGQWAVAPLEVLDRDGGVCFVGRDEGADQNSRLVLSEAACEEITAYIASLTDDSVPENARQALARLKGASDLFQELERGLKVTHAKKSFGLITSMRLVDGKETTGPVAHLARGPDAMPNPQAQRHGVVAFVLRDIDRPQTGEGKLAPS